VTRPRRSTVVAVTAGLLVVAVLVWLARPSGGGVPLDPRGTGPTGTAAMVRTAERLGAEVTIAATPPDTGEGTIVVLTDRFDDAVRDDIEQQVRAGARLVLFDPGSPLNPVPVAGQLRTDVLGVLGRAPDCPLLEGVADRVESARWTIFDPGAGATASCFPLDDEGTGLVVQPVGAGEVLVTSAVDALVNRTIADADHAQLAMALLAPQDGAEVTIVWDVALGGDTALLDLVPGSVRLAFWILVAAALLLAVARGRRLGPPVAERLPVRVPASELVLAIGELLGRHGHRDAAAARLRGDLRLEVARALHVPADTPPDVLVELLAARTGDDVDADGLRVALLDGPVPDDEALVAVTSALARVRHRVRHPAAAGPPTPGPNTDHQ
jgi:hypothetical protein